MLSVAPYINRDSIEQYARVFVRGIVASSLDKIGKENEITYFTEAIPQDLEANAVDAFFQNVEEGKEDFASDFEECPIEGLTMRFLKQTRLGWCLCRDYSISTRLAICHNFRKKIREDDDLYKRANRTGQLAILFFGSGLLLQELLQVRVLLEETKEWGVLRNVKRIDIYLKDRGYEIFETTYRITLNSFTVALTRLRDLYQVNVSCRICPMKAESILPEGVMLFSAVDVVDEDEELPQVFTTYIHLMSYYRSLAPLARCFITYRSVEAIEANELSESATILGDSSIVAIYDLFKRHAKVMHKFHCTLREKLNDQQQNIFKTELLFITSAL